MRVIRKILIEIILLLQIDRIHGAWQRLMRDSATLRLSRRIGHHQIHIPQGEGTLSIDGPLQNFKLGESSHLKSGTYIHTAGGVTIGSNFHTGRGLTIFSSKHVWRNSNTIPYDREPASAPVHIGNHVWFGVDVTVLPGTCVEDGCIVGAGAVLRGHYPKGSIVIGNPAKITGCRDLEHFNEKIASGAIF